jgi:hypothetical protein
MAWSSTNLTATQIADAADDKPLIGVRNVLTYATSAIWKDAAFASKTDGLEARCYDGLTGLYTAPTGAVAATWHLDCVLSGAPPFSFASFLINEAAAAVTSVAVKIADDAAHTVRAETIGTMATTAGVGRGVDLTLGDAGNPAPNYYSDVVYIRFTFTLSIADNPSVGEIFLGTRVQLENHPERPHDIYNLSGNTVIREAHSGAQTRYVFSSGKRNISCALRPWLDATADNIASIFTLSDNGNAPLIWCAEPDATPADFSLMHFRDPSFAMPHVGPNERNVLLELEEQGPHYQSGDD